LIKHLITILSHHTLLYKRNKDKAFDLEILDGPIHEEISHYTQCIVIEHLIRQLKESADTACVANVIFT